MKRILIVLIVGFLLIQMDAEAQCSICTKTAQQLGHKPAKGLNTGIIYLMFAPFAIIGWVGYNYFRSKRSE
ncbi:MAG TPA: hypothetical protein VK166_00130 [Chitinophagaceae bacterium]|nr:hypothetical protein [Chitinophagaceae bacterium]